MALSSRVTRPCSRCGQPVEAVLHQSLVIEDDASLRDVLEDRFHLLDCARCGERRAFEADFLVTNRPRDMLVQVVVRDDQVPGALASLREMLGDSPVFARVVPGREELVEKVKLRTQGLDDVAMEILKFFVRIQLHDLEGKTRRHFDRIEGQEALFRVRAPGQPPSIVRVPLTVYENVRREHDTAAHARDLEVDERLARRLLDEQRARSGPAATAPTSGLPDSATGIPATNSGVPAANSGVPAANSGVPTTSSGVPATSSGVPTGAPGVSLRPLAVTHAGSDRRGRRFVSDGSVLLLAEFVTSTRAATPALLTTETVEGLIGRSAARWTPIVDLVRSKLHARAYRTPDDVALGDSYVQLLLGLGRPLDLGTTERLGPVLLRDGADIVGTLMPLNLPPELAPAQDRPPPVDDGGEVRVPCPVCKGPIPRGDPFCEACGVGLAWAADGDPTPVHPELWPGRVLVSESFEHRPFPGRAALEEIRSGVFEARPVHGGKLAVYHAPVTQCFVDYARPLRDACVRATFTPLDPGARVGLAARHSILGGIQIYYLFDVMPLAGRAFCSRGVQTPRHATSTHLCPEARIPPIPPGAAVELELRVAGSTLRAFVNGQPVLAAHDAAFGSGAFGVRAGREHDMNHPVRVLCHGYEVREVLP